MSVEDGFPARRLPGSRPPAGTDRAARSAATELAGRLRARRALRFPTGSGFARELGWSQSKVSRIETGAALPAPADLRRWVAATSVPGGDDRAEARVLDGLLAIARQEVERPSPPSDPPRDDEAPAGERSWLGRYARRVELDEALSSAVREYAVGVLPALACTAEFVAAWCRCADDEVMAADRSRPDVVRKLLGLHTRHRALLYEGGERAPRLVVEEATLYRGPGAGTVLVDQLDHLARLLDAPAVDLRIVPAGAGAGAPPLSSFALYPRRVLVQTAGGDCWFRDAGAVAAFERTFAGLHRVAVDGSAAAGLVARARARAHALDAVRA